MVLFSTIISNAIPYGEFELFYRLIMSAYVNDIISEIKLVNSSDGICPEDELMVVLMDTLQA